MGERTILPAQLLCDSEAALRRAADLLADLGVDGHDDAAAASDEAASFFGFRDELRQLREQIDECAAEIAWCLHEAGALIHDLEKRLARVAAVAERFAVPTQHLD